MARPVTIRSQQILDAARQVFLAQGQGASTAAVARAAGVSEGSVFKHFGTKTELLRAALGIPTCPVIEELAGRAGQGQVRENLVQAGLGVIEFLRALLPRVMCLTPELRVACVQDHEGPPAPALLLQAVSGYIDREARLGRLRVADPRVAARLLVGACQNFVFFALIGAEPEPSSPEAFVRAVVDTLLQGLATAGAAGQP